MKKKPKNSSSNIISVMVSIMLLIEILTYSKIYLGLANDPYNRFEDIIFFIVPPIICAIVFILFMITSISKNKSLFLVILSMLAAWAPLMLVPAFVDMAMLKMMFSESMVVQVLPFISIAIVVLSSIKYIKISSNILRNKNKKIYGTK